MHRFKASPNRMHYQRVYCIRQISKQSEMEHTGNWVDVSKERRKRKSKSYQSYRVSQIHAVVNLKALETYLPWNDWVGQEQGKWIPMKILLTAPLMPPLQWFLLQAGKYNEYQHWQTPGEDNLQCIEPMQDSPPQGSNACMYSEQHTVSHSFSTTVTSVVMLYYNTEVSGLATLFVHFAYDN